ncbi:hypothetical protein [Ornithinibacillus massiliensis]|uniref:DUF5082 domain-containing protein n=1 Tax=Ornithinibacillus massiliensis TaxID=1944633 RepID=A0ABS5MDQ1_9BACI|nr:hypothetical protein [Ornithinibacillus massiliensis]MBS3680434.1 hypothetical protein [Ornithinibacillus massiliensis]
MGYILPIQQHEYSDYQRRMVTNKRTITTVEKPYKAGLQAKYEELQHQEEIRNNKVDLILNEVEQSVSEFSEVDAIYTEITGLGQFINERI